MVSRSSIPRPFSPSQSFALRPPMSCLTSCLGLCDLWIEKINGASEAKAAGHLRDFLSLFTLENNFFKNDIIFCFQFICF